MQSDAVLSLWTLDLNRGSRATLRTRRAIEESLVTRALRDEDFRREFVLTPRAVVGRELGALMDSALSVEVLDESTGTVFVVVPRNPYEHLDGDQLKELGLTLEDVATWALEQQRTGLPASQESAAVLARAWVDDSYYRELVADPRGFLSRELDIEIPDDVEVEVRRESEREVFIVLPEAERHALADLGWVRDHLDAFASDRELAIGSFKHGSASTVGACCCLITN
jgi:hypothetical protein